MKILNWFKNRSGKLALSALQTAGLATVVGVAGFGAYNLLSSPGQEGALSPSSYNPGEVVYVAGNAGSGEYLSASYAGQTGGPNESSVRVTANTLSRINAADAQNQAQSDMPQVVAPTRSSAVPSQAYEGGESEGLGMGANIANELGLKDGDPMASMQGMMENVKGMMAGAQEQVAGAASKGGATAGATAGAQSAAFNRASMASANGGGGNSFNSSFTVQDSGKNNPNGKAGAGNGDAQAAANALAAAQAKLAAATEGATLHAKASFGPQDGLGGSRDASVNDGGKVQDYKGRDDLEWMAGRSNKVATTKTRAANEGSAPFLASTQVSGGMQIEAENVTTGAEQGSQDFGNDARAQLRGINRWATSAAAQNLSQSRARHGLHTWMWMMVGATVAAMVAIWLLKHIPIWGHTAALALAVATTGLCAMAFVKAMNYARQFGGGTFSTVMMCLAPICIAGIWLSFAFAPKPELVQSQAQASLGSGSGLTYGSNLSAMGSQGLSAGAAGGLSGGTASGASSGGLLGVHLTVPPITPVP